MPETASLGVCVPLTRYKYRCLCPYGGDVAESRQLPVALHTRPCGELAGVAVCVRGSTTKSEYVYGRYLYLQRAVIN